MLPGFLHDIVNPSNIHKHIDYYIFTLTHKPGGFLKCLKVHVAVSQMRVVARLVLCVNTFSLCNQLMYYCLLTILHHTAIYHLDSILIGCFHFRSALKDVFYSVKCHKPPKCCMKRRQLQASGCLAWDPKPRY